MKRMTITNTTMPAYTYVVCLTSLLWSYSRLDYVIQTRIIKADFWTPKPTITKPTVLAKALKKHVACCITGCKAYTTERKLEDNGKPAEECLCLEHAHAQMDRQAENIMLPSQSVGWVKAYKAQITRLH